MIPAGFASRLPGRVSERWSLLSRSRERRLPGTFPSPLPPLALVRLCRSPSPSRRRFSPVGRPGRAAGPPLLGGDGRARTRPGGHCGPGAARQAGEPVGGASCPRGLPWPTRRVLWGACACGKAAHVVGPCEGKRLFFFRGSSFVVPSAVDPAWPRCVCGLGLVRPRRPPGRRLAGTVAAPRWAHVGEITPSVFLVVGGGGSGRCLPLPLSPRPGQPSACGLRRPSPLPHVPRERAVRSTFLPPSLHLSRSWPGVSRRPHAPPPLAVVGRLSGLPPTPLAWSRSRLLSVSRPRPEGSGFRSSPALRLAAVFGGGWPAAAPHPLTSSARGPPSGMVSRRGR